MAKKYGQRLKVLYVLEILKKHSDERHPITAEFICGELEKQGIPAERKSIYGDISALSEYGYNIIKSGAPRGWFLAEREFEEPEIYLLADAVRTAKFISASKTRELLSKLHYFVSDPQLKERESKVYFSPDTKCDNEEIYYSIDAISRAITEKKKINFDYVNRVLTDDRTIAEEYKYMKISPYALVWHDDKYYVLGNYEKYNNIIHLRLDRMRSVAVVKEKARHFSEVSSYKDYFDVPDYTEKLFSMYGGIMTEIELCCSKSIAEQIADRFGENIFIKNVTEKEFSFSVTAALSDALVSWIISYGDKVRAVYPPELCKMVTTRAQKVLDIYRNSRNYF